VGSGYVTVRPSRATERAPRCSAMSFSLALAMFVVCSSWENWAIWPMKSVSLVGLSGSWFFSWPTSNLRKSSLPRIVPTAVAALGVAVVPVVPVAGAVVFGTVGIVLAFARQARTSTSTPFGSSRVLATVGSSVS